MSNTYKRKPDRQHRTPRHKQQLAQYYGAIAERLPRVRIQDYEAIKEGAWADLNFSRWYSDRKERGRRKVRRIEKRRRIRRKHPRNSWVCLLGDK